MRSFRHPRWQHLDYRVKVAPTQENKPPTQGTRQWTFTTPRWRCGSILLPSLNAGVPEPTGGFRTVAPVWIHPWPWNDAQSLKQNRRGALLFFKVIHQISRSHGTKIADFDPNWGFPDCNSSLNSLMAMKWCTKLDIDWIGLHLFNDDTRPQRHISRLQSST